MGFFEKPDAGSTGLRALSQEMIVDVLKRHGWEYFVDEDGDVGGIWDDNLFFFLRMGKGEGLFQVRGKWNRTVPVDSLPTALDLVNQFNVERVWPKAYVRVEEDELGVYAETSTDLSNGVAPEQLDLLLRCGLFTALEFFGVVAESDLPTLATEPA